MIVQNREHEAQVARDRRLAGEQRLHPCSMREVAAVDLVVEGDHLVGELDVVAGERVQRPAQRAQTSSPSSWRAASSSFELLLERRSSSEAPGDVALRALVGGVGEDLLGLVVLDQDARALAVA